MSYKFVLHNVLLQQQMDNVFILKLVGGRVRNMYSVKHFEMHFLMKSALYVKFD